jgi:hypothetical protein
MSNTINPRLIPITPMQMYLQIINSGIDAIRQVNNGYSYIPSQFGGIFGQLTIQQQGLVMEITPFEVK